MSSRALRKAQREREAQHTNDVDSEEEEVLYQPPKKSAFAMLDVDDEEDEDIEQAEDTIDNHQSEDVAIEIQPKAPSKKKKKKKGKKVAVHSNGHSGKKDDAELDEIDKALRELRTYGDTTMSGATKAGQNAATEETSKLLAVDSSHLHAQNEMRRLFGRAVVAHQDDEEQPQEENVGGNRRQQRRIQQVGLAQALRGNQPGGRKGALTTLALKRNIFIQGKEEWPNATGGGLGMEVEEKRADGTILYRYVRNGGYEDVQRQFDIAVESMDPDRLILLLQQNPYHIATLLQVSEIAKQDRNHSVSGDLLERALFSFGRAAHSTFSKNLADGKARLDFRRPQNREFWLASWRYMQNLSMRATWRTVYEWTKLLLQLSPDDDPYSMWLVLDQYALRARQDLDYLNISRSPLFKSRRPNFDMPNVELSQGLAEWRAGNKGKGQQALFKAVGRFPWVVARLMQELNLDPPPAVWGKEPRTDRERLSSETYGTRAKDLWATPEASALLMEVASALPPDVQPAEIDDDAAIQENEARHILLSDTPALIGLIPRHFTNRLVSSSDPLPPLDTYDFAAQQSRSRTDPSQMSEEEIDNMEVEFTSLSSLIQARLAVASEPDPSADRLTEELMSLSETDRQAVLTACRRLPELYQILLSSRLAQGREFAPSMPSLFRLRAGTRDGDDSDTGMQARDDDVEDAGD